MTADRMAAGLSEWPGREPEDALALLLGQRRARVVRALEEPATTQDLAPRLGLAESTVSEHLGRLLRSGVVDRVRDGREVYYQLSSSGRLLVRLIASRSQP